MMAAPRSWFPTTFTTPIRLGRWVAALRRYSHVRWRDGRAAVGLSTLAHHAGPADGLIHLLAAPDLDADGVRDVVVISRYSGEGRMGRSRVESMSTRYPVRAGEDSGPGTELTNADTTPIGSAFWWGLGSDGWPMLAVPIGGKPESGGDPDYRLFPPDPPVVHLLAAATGIEEHAVPGLTSPRVADLTGDGLADLWGAVDGKLVAIRAEPAEAGVLSVDCTPREILMAMG